MWITMSSVAHSYVLHGSQPELVTTPLYNAYNCYGGLVQFLPHQNLVNIVSYTTSHSVPTVASPSASFISLFSSANVASPSVGLYGSKDIVWYSDSRATHHITSDRVASDMWSSQSDATFLLVIVSPEGLNEVDTQVVDGIHVDTNSGVNEFVAPIVDGPRVDTNLASFECHCSSDQSIESQEVQVDPRVCPGSMLDSTRALRVGPGVCQGSIMAPTVIGDVGTVLSPVAGEQAMPHESGRLNPTPSISLGAGSLKVGKQVVVTIEKPSKFSLVEINGSYSTLLLEKQNAISPKQFTWFLFLKAHRVFDCLS
ncbi:hypothetical protein GQ457_01G016330 [Hibiscus cannabinus]